MIIKVSIKNEVIHLPRDQKDLTEIIKKKYYKRKPLVKSGFSKLYQISNIDNDDIEYEKSVNIFLVNLYLLVLQYKGELINEKINMILSDENIKEELSKILNVKFTDLSIEEIETKVEDYISKENKEIQNNEEDENKETDFKVEFNIDWVREMDKHLKE